MSDCTQYDEALAAAAVDGDLSVSLEVHLSGCARCSRHLAEFGQTLSIVDAGIPARAEVVVPSIWPKLAEHVNATPVNHKAGSSLNPLLLAAAMLLVGIAIGLIVRSPISGFDIEPGSQIAHQTSPLSTTAIGTGQPDYRADYLEFLERATPLLLSLANRQGTGLTETVAFDAQLEQSIAGQLATSGLSLEHRLRESEQDREAALVGDLSLVFLQLANLPHDRYPDSLEMVQNTIESRALLFQLTVEALRRDTESQMKENQHAG